MFYCTSLLNESFFSFKIMSNMLFLVRYRSFQWVFKWVSILFWNTFVMSSAKYSQNNIHSWNSDSTFIHHFYLLSSNWCFDTNEPKKKWQKLYRQFHESIDFTSIRLMHHRAALCRLRQFIDLTISFLLVSTKRISTHRQLNIFGK